MQVIDMITNAIGSIVGIDGETVKQFSYLVIILKVLEYLFDAFTKKYANMTLDWFVDHTQADYSFKKQFNYFEEVSYNKYVGLHPNVKELTFDPLQTLYALRLELAKKHMIDYEVEDYLDSKSVKSDFVNKDKQIVPNLKKVAMNFANQVSSEQSERTKNLFAKNKFGLISSSFVEGKVAYVLMIAIGASYGIIYENTVYLKCIEIISEKLLENQRKLELSDLQCVSAVLDLTGLLLPTYNLERDLITFGNLFLENYNPNITPEVINDGNSCFFRKSKYDKNDFDLIEEKCYECIKSCLNSNEGDY